MEVTIVAVSFLQSDIPTAFKCFINSWFFGFLNHFCNESTISLPRWVKGSNRYDNELENAEVSCSFGGCRAFSNGEPNEAEYSHI